LFVGASINKLGAGKIKVRWFGHRIFFILSVIWVSMKILSHKEDMEKDGKESPPSQVFAGIIIAISGLE